MVVSNIMSRPIYCGLKPDEGARRHLVAAEGDGAHAVIDAFDGNAVALAKTTVVYCADGSSHAARLAALKPNVLDVMPSTPTLLIRLAGHLQGAAMGLRVYAAGTESFIGAVATAVAPLGIDHAEIGAERRGSFARRVQCVHCKGITGNVMATPYVCSHCGLNLLVRDHYSWRLGAFQGVCVDAEVPGDIPPVEEFNT